MWRCCLIHLKKLCEASHNTNYVKHIVMRSDWKSVSDYQRYTKTLLRSTSHNISYFFRPLSQSRRFWFFWMASFCTLVVHKYHPRICSARCKASCRPPLQGHWWLPWWQPSAWIASGQSPSKSMSLRFAWVCIVWCWLSSMKAGRERGGHQTGRPSCDVSDAGSDRSSTDGWYYEKLHIIPTNGSSSIFT